MNADVSAAPSAPTAPSAPAVAAAPPRPRLRGWIHVAATPLALILGMAAVVWGDTWPQRLALAVFTISSVVLFGTSAIYHRGRWAPRPRRILRRTDHANIFALIAGTFTPLAILLLDQNEATSLLVIAWGGAVAGILARQFWIAAPRWAYVPIYLAHGLVAVWFLPAFARSGGVEIAGLVALGGVVYILGALAYGLRRPDPLPGTFGHHEIFHACTVIAWLLHWMAILLAAG